MLHKRYQPLLPWSFALLLFLTACGGGSGPDFSNQEGVEVNIFAGLGSTSSVETSDLEANDLETQGVPSNPETGETGVDSAELEVFSGDTQLFFDDGRIVDEGAGDTVTLTPDDSDVSLFLPQGSYRFALTALDEQGNVLAQGETEQQVDEDSRVSIPMVSLIGSARFEVPESIKGNQVFDAFVRVSPPGREDLEVALGDFSVTYDVQEPSVQLEGSSNIGVRIAAACDVVEVSATLDNDLSETVNASATIPVNDSTCEGTGTDAGTDLVSPYVSINTPQADATLNKSFTLQGDVNDQQSGIDKVEVYEGTVKLGDADVNADNRSWSFDASLDDGSYTLIAVAFDKAGNSSRAEVNVTVKEGSGNEVENCTSPVNIPDEVLRNDLKATLGLDEQAEITCEALRGLTRFSRASTDENDDAVEISTLEGLQFAVNLRELVIAAAVIEDYSAIADLTKLEVLELADLKTQSLAPLRNLTALSELVISGYSYRNADFAAEDEDALASLLNLQTLSVRYYGLGDISVLQNLTKLNSLGLTNNDIRSISPLIGNSGLGEGDFVYFGDNPLETCPGTDDRADIDTLIERGVDVSFDEPENCDGEGGNGGGDNGEGDDDNGGSDDSDDNDGGDNGEGDDDGGNDDGGDNSDATITVNSTSGAASLEGECTLRAAITAANTDTAVGGCPAGNGADTVVLADDATYTLSEVDNTVATASGLPAVSSEITVEGNGATVERSDANTTPDFRPFHVAEAGTLTLKNMSVQGGALSDSDFVDSDKEATSGGGVYNEGTLTLTQVVLQNNSGVGGGGLSNAGTALVTDSNINENSGQFGGAPTSQGGGVRNTGELEVRSSTVNNNSAFDGAGIGNFGSITVLDSAVDDNQGDGSGGLYNTGEVVLEGSTLSGLTCCTTGALFNSETGKITARDSRISGGDDGDTLVNRGEILFERVIYSGERELENSGTMTLVESTIRSNGDTISNSGTMTIANSTVSNSTGTFDPTGIENYGTLTISYSTLANNGTLENRGEAGALILEGSIVAYAADESGDSVPNCSGPITSQGYNLDSDGSCNFGQDTDLSSVDPLLGELQDNGGPTPTHVLQEGSPALDAIPTDVCSVETDQRGVERPQGSACDIGAFELEQ